MPTPLNYRDTIDRQPIRRQIVRPSVIFIGSEDVDMTAKYASTANVSPSAHTATTLTFGSAPAIDGYTPVAGDIVVLKNQTDYTQNGPYKVGAGNVWTRNGTLTPGMLISVRKGTRNAGSIWVLCQEGPIVPGTTQIYFQTRTYNEYVTVKAADTSKSTTMDGQTIVAGDHVLVVSGADIGVWEFEGGSTWQYLDIPQSVGVRLGPTYGLLTLFLNSVGNGYTRGQAVYG